MGMDSQAQARNVRAHPPCSACRILRRRCDVNCILAPFFPAEEAENFVRVHKVFGASNVIKMLQMVDESRREDTVKSMVYEAHTRLKDPVYGCTGAIFYLQKHVKELEQQLQSARAEATELRGQREQLLKAFMDAHLVDPFSPVINDSVFDHFFVDAAAAGPCSVPANSYSSTM
ncbi:hypothetical protein H6P81_013978 [Aristolochia fimbriata]|uniref:LOB domain-containing protein n=1 Tax=Aristolochia fimbriata TaxID=158543 RepID=A0AAV7EIC7_ARIFI|nr:hypothetical protein H6P81_013978 [Aristolochia fimbriata]